MAVAAHIRGRTVAVIQPGDSTRRDDHCARGDGNHGAILQRGHEETQPAVVGRPVQEPRVESLDQIALVFRTAEDGRGDQAGSHKREDDAHERAHARSTVDHRRLLEVGRDVVHESTQRPHHEGQHHREVIRDHSDQAVDLADRVEQQVDGDDQRVQRHHLHADDHDDESRPAPKPEPRDGDGGQERDNDGDGDDRKHDGQAVDHVVPEERHLHRGDEVVERGRRREPVRVEAEDLLAGLERCGDHPVDRKDHHGEDQQPGPVVEDAQPCSSHAPASLIERTVWRT